MNDYQWDKQLNIDTTGRDASNADEFHHPYEPTPYVVLERFAESGYIRRSSKVVDYGCGKGRVSFFMNHMLGCNTIGLEYDDKIFGQAIQNREDYFANHQKGVEFLCKSAEEYVIVDEDCFYFFNPFTVEILRAVISRIITSYYENPRQMFLFFYYPDDEYISYLMTVDKVSFLDEIDCRDLFKKEDSRERILVFEVG